MSCHTFRDDVLDVARRAASEVTRARVAAHLASCPDCRRQLEEQEVLTAGLRALADRYRDDEPSPALEPRLVALFVEQRGREALPAGARPAGPRSAYLAWLAAAAVLVLGIGAAMAWRVSGGPTGAGESGPARPPVPAMVLAREASPVPPPESWPGTASTPASRRHSGPAATAADTAPPPVIYPSGFFLLPAAASLPAFESGEIVRVELGVGALPAFGIDIPADAGEGRVQVDVLVGQDGHPRAIRTVTEELPHPRSRQ